MSYLEQVKDDVLEYIHNNYSHEEVVEEMQDKEHFVEKLEDILWTEDSVTGNGSGSYTFNNEEAKNYVLEDVDAVLEAVREFCCGMDAAEILKKLFEENWEYFDVTARCYFLNPAICEALEEIEAEIA